MLVPLVLTAPERGWLWWVYMAVAAVIVLLILANRWLLPAVTGMVALAMLVIPATRELRSAAVPRAD